MRATGFRMNLRFHNVVLALSLLVPAFSATADDEKMLEAVDSGRTQALSEEKVLELFRNGAVSSRQQKALSAQTQLAASLTRESYQARAFTNFNLKRSQEEQQNLYQPVLDPYEDWNFGVEKKTSLGTRIGVEAFGSKYSFRGGPVTDATQVGGRIRADIDLWKNIFGSLDRAQLTSAEARSKRAQIEEKLNLKKRELAMRRAYWSFVASSLSVDLSEELIKTASRQLQDVRGRAKEGAADRGEVARYQSQVESRKAAKLLFMYEREVLMQAFEQEFATFRSSQWKLDVKSLPEKQRAIEQCLVRISENQEPNLDHTDYDEMIALLKKETDSEIRVAEKHGDIDLSLIGAYQTTGVDTNYDSARKEITDQQRGGYQVGLQLSVPLGGEKKTSEKLLLRAKKESLEAEAQSLENGLRSQHETMLKAMLYLRVGLKSQVTNTQNLTLNYQEMQRKYRQGRISVSTLVFEQDSLFQSQLSEINLRRQITHVLLDYFNVFNQFPCSWNSL